MTCMVALNSDQTVAATFAQPNTQGMAGIQHIIFMLQENRSFDHYFGHLPGYWAANNFPQARNGTTFDAEPANGSNLETDGITKVTAFPLTTKCVENPSPSWNEDHIDYNWHNNFGPYLGDGFVHTASGEKNVAGGFAGMPYYDQFGQRAMGFYTDSTLNYYYFMASTFGTSDRWFSPVLSRTEPNRMYLLAGTSDGHGYPITCNPTCPPPLPSETIFEALDKAGISWKIYKTDTSPSFLGLFSYISAPGVQAKIVPVNPNYFNDLAAGTLPQVAMIEAGYGNGLDEHPTGDDTKPGTDIQKGAAYVSTLINGLMKSSSWSSSVFILSWDEGGGFYDHVSPQPEPSPDGILPNDLHVAQGDICTSPDGSINSDPTCRFETTGYRVPLIVVSPFSKKNFVSHTVRDYTAILKLIEMRFGLANLTARDAAQPDMLEFFDFTNVPWRTPPTPPAQLTSGSCVIEALGSTVAGSNGVNITPIGGGQATVSLTLNKAGVQDVTVKLSGSPGISGLPSSVPIPAGSTAATPFTISAPSGTVVTITGSIGGIAVSGSATMQ
jgi:phospholipase C